MITTQIIILTSTAGNGVLITHQKEEATPLMISELSVMGTTADNVTNGVMVTDFVTTPFLVIFYTFLR